MKHAWKGPKFEPNKHLRDGLNQNTYEKVQNRTRTRSTSHENVQNRTRTTCVKIFKKGLENAGEKVQNRTINARHIAEHKSYEERSKQELVDKC